MVIPNSNSIYNYTKCIRLPSYPLARSLVFLSPSTMEAEPRDGYSVSIPLLLDNDEKQYKLGSVDHHPCTGHSSFFNTCFNGLNALSGPIFFLQLDYIMHMNCCRVLWYCDLNIRCLDLFIFLPFHRVLIFILTI